MEKEYQILALIKYRLLTMCFDLELTYLTSRSGEEIVFIVSQNKKRKCVCFEDSIFCKERVFHTDPIKTFSV